MAFEGFTRIIEECNPSQGSIALGTKVLFFDLNPILTIHAIDTLFLGQKIAKVDAINPNTEDPF